MTRQKHDEEMNDYIGDGVYVSFDGYHIWIAVNDHRNKVVALEPEVMKKLILYSERIGMIDLKK